MRSLFKNAKILLYNDVTLKWEVLENGYLGIEDDKISYVDSVIPSDEKKYDVIKDAKGMLLIPGLYNLHTHSSMVLLRGLGNELPLDRWLNEAMFPIEAKLQKEHIELGVQLAMLEMLACGTVSFTDMYFYPENEAQIVEKVGMKANICLATMATDPMISYENNDSVKKSLSFWDNLQCNEESKVKADLGIHAEYTSNRETLQKFSDDCKKRNARLHFHLSETQKEHEECKQRNNGKTPTEFFESLGIFENPTIAAHCVWVEENDITILSKSKATVVHNPSSNLKLGSGFMPFTKLQENNVAIALGTDGAASNNNLNMIEEINLAALIHKGAQRNPTVVAADSLLTAATITGANAQGRKNCGKIAVGYKADIVGIKLDSPHLLPDFDMIALLVYSLQASDVAFTMIDGKVLYENGEYKTIDKEKILFETKQMMKELIK